MTREQIIKKITDVNLFFSRIMKEHCILLAASLSLSGGRMVHSFDRYNVNFENILSDTLINAVLPENAESEQYATERTSASEKRSMEMNGITINLRLTEGEIELLKNPKQLTIGRLPILYERHKNISARAMELVKGLIDLKKSLYDQATEGKLASSIYPMDIEHMISEAQSYLKALEEIEKEEQAGTNYLLSCARMKEHSEVIRGGLDPTEDNKITIANSFAAAFSEQITRIMSGDINRDELYDLQSQLCSFKKELTTSVLLNKTRATISALNLDHFYREGLRFLYNI